MKTGGPADKEAAATRQTRVLPQARIAVGLRSTAQSVSIIGIRTGQFEAAGLLLNLAQIETAGPAAVHGLQHGDWEFAEFGAVPVVQAIEAGNELAIIASAEPSSALFLMTQPGIDRPSALAGARIGVLSIAGQTGFLANLVVERWGIAGGVRLVPLQTYPEIYRALRAGEIEAGVLSADYRFDGEREARLNALVDLAELLQLQGPCVTTTRRFIREQADIVHRFLKGYVQSIHLFKTQPQRVLPLLQEHLGFSEPVIRQIYEFYAERFQRIPWPSKTGIERTIAEVCGSSPAALSVEQIWDLSFLKGIEAQR
jgi:ABC-type nitrate/sulfonate/bicarbonate transport system substrate-binding protein